MKLVDEFMSIRFGRITWTMIKSLSKLPFVQAKFHYVKINDQNINKFKDSIDISEKTMDFIKEQLKKYKNSGKSKSYVINEIDKQFKKYAITFDALPRLVHDLWDEI